MKQCIKCGNTKPIEDFPVKGSSIRNQCRTCYNANSKAWRDSYKTEPSVFLLRKYRAMKQRVTSNDLLSKGKYRGLDLIDKDVFIQWSLENPDFLDTYKAWQDSKYDSALHPSILRVNKYIGYVLDNIEWTTFSNVGKDGARITNQINWGTYGH